MNFFKDLHPNLNDLHSEIQKRQIAKTKHIIYKNENSKNNNNNLDESEISAKSK